MLVKRLIASSFCVASLALVGSCEALVPVLQRFVSLAVASMVNKWGADTAPADIQRVITGDPESRPSTTPDTPSLTAELRLFKTDRTTGERELLVEDGATLLTDGAVADYADIHSDEFHFEAVFSEPCYFYIVNFDATAFPHQIQPARGESARVEAGVTVTTHLYKLDQFEGKETFYIIASREPRTDLERIMARWPDPTDRRLEDVEARVGPADEDFIEVGVQERGVISSGVPGEFIRAEYGDFVVTRWFWHRVE